MVFCWNQVVLDIHSFCFFLTRLEGAEEILEQNLTAKYGEVVAIVQVHESFGYPRELECYS